MSKKFYITTPIYYVNARPHIGHAYTTLACDTIARRQRMLGADTFFLTGTDEHGQKIERAAQAAGKTPQQYADEISAQFRALWKRMGLTNDDRQAAFLGDGEQYPLGAGTLLNTYLKNVEDREGAVHTVGRDRRRWGRPFDTLKNTKNIGW